MNMKKQSGFTLIELVMVIVILGILAAVALPKFIDLKADASNSATQGVAGSLGAASAINKATRLVSIGYGVSVSDCKSVSGALDSFPSGYTITAGATTTSGVSCTVTGPNAVTATFTGYSS